MGIPPKQLVDMPPSEYKSLLEWWRIRYPARGREVELLLAELIRVVLAVAGGSKMQSPYEIAHWLKPVDYDKQREKEQIKRQTDFALSITRNI